MQSNQITKNFDKAASSYDSSALIQNTIGEHLIQTCPSNTPSKILDIGSGTGKQTQKLANKFPNASLIAIDPCKNMTKFSKVHANNPSITYLNQSIETFQTEDRFDLITSNLTFQWMPNVEEVLKKPIRTAIKRVFIKVMGHAMPIPAPGFLLRNINAGDFDPWHGLGEFV